jgi:AcrR family transcriptional regulator
MTTAKRDTYTPETLLSVVVQVFNERGYDGTSMEDLSRKLGITKSAIYHHVDSKHDLLRLGTGRALDALFTEVDKLAQVEGRAIDRLEHLVRGSVLVLAGNLPFVTLLLRVRGNTKVEREALARRREFDRLVAGLVAAAADEGDLRSDIDPAVTARLLFGLVNSLIDWYRPRGAAAADQLADTVVAVAFDGLRVRPAD